MALEPISLEELQRLNEASQARRQAEREEEGRRAQEQSGRSGDRH